MKFTDNLRQKTDGIWQKIFNHPFVQGIGDGTLAPEKYRYYMCQDYVYLIDYAKLFALACIKSPDLETMQKFAELLNETLTEEMESHRRNAARLGISNEELENSSASPTLMSYANYMLKVAQEGTIIELNAVLLPCMWVYCEIGKNFQNKTGINHEIYGEWIRTYSGKDFVDLTNWMIELMDKLVEGKTDRELKKIENFFITASKYEYMFWDMAYKEEKWLI